LIFPLEPLEKNVSFSPSFSLGLKPPRKIFNRFNGLSRNMEARRKQLRRFQNSIATVIPRLKPEENESDFARGSLDLPKTESQKPKTTSP
jgi:hypothetical protein